MKREARFVVVVLLPGLLVCGALQTRGADDKKAPNALETMRAFLTLALTGQTKAAADLGEPGKSYSREEKIKKAFERLDAKKPPAIVRFLADDASALAITESVTEKRKEGKTREGPLSIRLVKKDKRWLVRDIDMGNKSAASNLERFQREHPQAKIIIPKNDK